MYGNSAGRFDFKAISFQNRSGFFGAGGLAEPVGLISKLSHFKTDMAFLISKQRDSEVVVSQVVFGRPGVPRPTNHTCSEKIIDFWPCRIRWRSKKTTHFWKMFGVVALVPQASKETRGKKKHSGIPLKNRSRLLLLSKLRF